MRIFILCSDVPHREDSVRGVTATHIVTDQIITSLRDLGHPLTLQLVFNEYRIAPSLTDREERELRRLEEQGIKVLNPVFFRHSAPPPPPPSRWGKLRQLVQRSLPYRRIAEFYPAVAVRDAIQDRIEAERPDALLTLWSPEGVTATSGIRHIPRICYHGDVEFMPALARWKDRSLFDEGHRSRWRDRILERIRLFQFRGAHLELMRDVDVIANVTAANADYYKACRHRRSIYLPNTWKDLHPNWEPRGSGDVRNGRKVKIIGHIGELNRTGTTYGLHYLLERVLPALDSIAGDLDYEVHVIGGGDPKESLQPFFRHRRVIRRGYVQDMQSELQSCDMMLLLNNAGSYIAAYTRHVVAWSMGLCLIVHANSRKAIPEIRHGENCLLGSTPEEIARMIVHAATDLDLNQRLRRGGRATYQRSFAPPVVARALCAEIERCRLARRGQAV